MNEFLRFENLITPIVIQVVFWILVVLVIIAGLANMFSGGWSTLLGLLEIVLGPILVRVYCELVIVFFRINDHLREIQRNTQRGSIVA